MNSQECRDDATGRATGTEKARTMLVRLLSRLCACEDAIAWVEDRTAEAAWNECPCGDWLLWVAARVGVDRKLVVRAACACARLALPHVPAGEGRPLRAIEAAEAWCEGRATIGE